MSDQPDAVHTVYEWYDGPRSGAADYRGAAYWYWSLYLLNKESNRDEDRFNLTPLTSEAFGWVVERDAIFRRWDAARQAGTIVWRDGDEERFGAFPEDMDRYRNLNRSIESYLADHPANILVRGSFAPGCHEVRWTFISETGSAEPGGAANGSQPGGSQTSGSSPAAGSGGRPHRSATGDVANDLTEFARTLGYTSAWFALGVVDNSVLDRQRAVWDSREDNNTEHYRYSSFREFLTSHHPVSPDLAMALFELGATDTDHVMGGAIMADIVRLSECPPQVLAAAVASGRKDLIAIVERRKAEPTDEREPE